ncbi:hypothetical protein I3843_09G056600 [Carya illinoinensis]|nr:hypothetical protein I3843_09G056600 [Carya illinoinensis]
MLDFGGLRHYAFRFSWYVHQVFDFLSIKLSQFFAHYLTCFHTHTLGLSKYMVELRSEAILALSNQDLSQCLHLTTHEYYLFYYESCQINDKKWEYWSRLIYFLIYFNIVKFEESLSKYVHEEELNEFVDGELNDFFCIV